MVVLWGEKRVVGNPKKPLTDSEIRSLVPGSKRQNHTLGNSLFLTVETVQKGSSKRFLGRYRFPSGRGGKQREYAIGVYGKKAGQFSLRAAREEWEKVRAWGKETGGDLQDYKRQQRKALLKQQNAPTLQKAVDAYLASSKLRVSTLNDYTNCLQNQVLPGLGAHTPLKDFTWSQEQSDGRTGRQVVLDWKKEIEKRAPIQSDKALMVLRQVFAYAIDHGWLEHPNPALVSKHAKSNTEVKHHPTIPWGELPAFFDCLHQNKPNGSVVVVAAVKVLFLTFLRVGSLSGLRWSELDYDDDLWVVPAGRMKNRKPHLVPLTAPLKEVLEQLRDLNGHQDYAFFTGRTGGKYPHMNPSSITNHLKNLGYSGILVGHGVRSIALTEGQQILGYSAEVIQRQMSHVVGDKVRQAYDHSQMLDERREFMNAWSDALLERGLRV